MALGIVALGFFVRARGISEYWLSPDEGIYFSTLTHSRFSDFWAEVAANAHPPAFYLLLRVAGYVTWDFVALRATTALFGALAIWAVWLVGFELGGRGRGGTVAGLASAGLVALNPDMIVLSQILRPYMMLLALTGLALVQMLRYRREPTDRRLFGFAALMSLALLTHYSAALALAACWAWVAWAGVAGSLPRPAWRRLVMAQIVPGAVLGLLYVQHLGRAVGSDLMGDALDPGGWLSDWLISSPREAWRGFLGFQILALPPALQGRSSLVVLSALAAVLATRDRDAAILGVGALAVAILASALGAYPFGPTRHGTWLVLFVVPVIGVGLARLSSLPGRTRWLGAAGLAALLLASPLERVMGAGMLHTNVTDERPISRAALAPLVVAALDPDRGPHAIVMTEQPYNLLMPLFAVEREADRVLTTPDQIVFRHGSRRVFVTRRWDFPDVQAVAAALDRVPVDALRSGDGERALVLVGGWGSDFFGDVPALEREGIMTGSAVALGEEPSGEPIMRLLALEVDARALKEKR